MKARAVVLAALVATVLGQVNVSSAAATDPAPGMPPVVSADADSSEGGIYGWDGITYVPLTAEQLAAVQKKALLAERSRLTNPRTPAPNGIDATCRNGTCGTILPVWYRHQANGYYCGPTAVQVISNHAWGYGTAGNKYTQAYISSQWTQTTAEGTYVWRVRYGLNGSTAGKYPWPYAEEYVSSGTEWHGYVVADTTDWNMPTVALVAPHDPNVTYYLSSWPYEVTAGHYIVIRGWLYLWDGTRTPMVYYSDGSAGYGGSDGQYSDPAYDVYQTIKKSHPGHSEGWIVW